MEKQEQEYQEYLKNIHKKRYEKQQVIYHSFVYLDSSQLKWFELQLIKGFTNSHKLPLQTGFLYFYS